MGRRFSNGSGGVHAALVFGVSTVLMACQHLEPGDEFADGLVVSRTDLGGGCESVVYEVEPEWDCTTAQFARAEAVYGAFIDETGYGYESDYGGGFAVPSAPTPDAIPFEQLLEAEQIDLAPASCSELAEIEREAVRGDNAAYIARQATSALRACLPTRKQAYRQHGVEVEYCSGEISLPSGDADSGGGLSSASGGTGGGGGSDGASEYSTTNNQVAAVEEADYIKNDSGHVFVLTPGALRVFDTWPVADSSEIARVELDAEPRRLLLAGNELVVFSRVLASGGGYGAYDEAFGGSVAANPSDQGCTYGYDCRFQSEGGGTKVEVFDVSNPAAPTLLRGYALSGGYVASRRIGRTVHLVVHNDSTNSPRILPEVQNGLVIASASEAEEAEAELLGRMNTLVDEMPEDELLPRAEDDARRKGGCEDALQAGEASGRSLVSLVSFDLDELGELDRTLVATTSGYVYASADALYLAAPGAAGDWRWGYYMAGADSDVSVIHKFALGDGSSSYRGSALVRGHVLNQFAMDEHEGVLRLATTSGWVPDANVKSTISTLHEVDGRLRRYGELTGLAPTEDIRSVRFDGARGFVVTFKKTDPLFALDLSHPEAPAVLGELKIPGFSTYMHPIDADHLLAVGFDADDHGDFAYFDGIQLQMFDVSDMTNPTLLHKLVIGTRGSGSEALLNHLAFNYFPARQQLAMPITVCEGGDDGLYGQTMSFSGLIVFDVSIDGGITEHGRMPFADPAAAANADYSYGGGGCGQWWSQSTSNVKRSIFFDDYVVGLSHSELRAAHIDSMQNLLVNLPLVDGSTEPTSSYYGY